MSKFLITDAARSAALDAVKVVSPCLRVEEQLEALSIITDALVVRFTVFAEKIRREDKRLARKGGAS